jgi:hypothetical protein
VGEAFASPLEPHRCNRSAQGRVASLLLIDSWPFQQSALSLNPKKGGGGEGKYQIVVIKDSLRKKPMLALLAVLPRVHHCCCCDLVAKRQIRDLKGNYELPDAPRPHLNGYMIVRTIKERASRGKYEEGKVVHVQTTQVRVRLGAVGRGCRLLRGEGGSRLFLPSKATCAGGRLKKNIQGYRVNLVPIRFSGETPIWFRKFSRLLCFFIIADSASAVESHYQTRHSSRDSVR